MVALDKSFISSIDRKILIKFIGMLQKCGNKQRAQSLTFSLINKLKQGLSGYPVINEFPLHTLGETDPIQLINRCLYDLKPAFYICRTIKSGRLYNLPIPISENRSYFMAIDWLRKTALKNNRNDLSIVSSLAQEISAVLHQQGSSKNFLKAYIDIALDQRPFSRFIKRRFYVTSKSKKTKIAAHLREINKNIRRSAGRLHYRGVLATRKINMHNYRDDLKKSDIRKVQKHTRNYRNSRINRRKKNKR